MDNALREIPRKLKPLNLPCRCGHNLASHEHLPCDNGARDHSCGYPACHCREFVGAGTPGNVLRAIETLALYCKSVGYGAVKIGAGGGASFELKDDPV